MIPTLKELIPRLETWPEEAQAELLALALEIEAEHSGAYDASDDELAAIDAALEQAARGDVVPESEAAAIFARALKG